MTAMTAVREYCNDDQHQLRDLAFRNYISVHSPASEIDPHAPGFQAYFQHLTGQHDQGGGHIFVAERDTQLIGLVCLLGPIPPSQAESSDESYVFMSDLFVDEQHRGQGVGSQLVAYAENAANKLGVPRIALRVMAGNTVARRFYAGAAYAEDFVVMSKDIR